MILLTNRVNPSARNQRHLELRMRLHDAVRRGLLEGKGIPAVPGILPIARFRQMLSFATRCGARVPPWLHERFEGLDDDLETQRMLGASVAIEQVATLRRHGIREFHFYTLNRAELTYAICYALGLRPEGMPVAGNGEAAP